MKKTYTIPNYRLEAVIAQLAKLQKKAARYGCKLQWDLGNETIVSVPVFNEWKHTLADAGTNYEFKATFLTIEGDLVKCGDYEVIAQIEHLDGGNVVSSFNGNAANPEWRKVDCSCDHCKTSRNRKLIFIVRGKDGEKKIGSTCLKDYAGIDPHRIALIEEINEVINSVEPRTDEEREGFRESRLIRTDLVMSAAIKTWREQGYVKADQPQSNKIVVAARLAEREVFTPNELEEARAMIKTIAEMDDKVAERYLLLDAKALCGCSHVEAKHLGRMAYAPVAYNKYATDQQSAASSPGFVGDIGGKVTVKVASQLTVTTFHTGFGDKHVIKMTDDEGHVLTWFTTNPKDLAGKTIVATVKSHKEYRGELQTEITRPKAS